MPWFEPFEALQLHTSPRRRDESGMCHFEGTLWDKGWALSKEQRGSSRKGRFDNISFLLTSLFCPALALALIQLLEGKKIPQANKNCLCCSAETFIGEMAAAPTGENELSFLWWSPDLIWHKITCKPSKCATTTLPRVWPCPETTATAVLVATYDSILFMENKTHSPPLPPYSSPHSLPLKAHLNFNSIQAQSHLAAKIILISIFTIKTGIAAWSSCAPQTLLFTVSGVSF